MITHYTHTVTIACPSDWITDGNSIACLLGENPPGDIETFVQPNYAKDADLSEIDKYLVPVGGIVMWSGTVS